MTLQTLLTKNLHPGDYSNCYTVKAVILARLHFGDSPVLDELVCFYFHGAEFTPIDLCTNLERKERKLM